MTSHPGTPPVRSDGDAGGTDISLGEVWATLVRNRLLVAGTVVLSVAAAALLTWLQDPVYQSQATLRIEENDRAGNVLASISPVGGISRGKLETEMRVLESRRIAESVVDSLDLTVRVSEPAAPREEVLRIHELGRTGGEGMYQLTRRPDGSYGVEARNTNPAVRPPRTVAVGAPFTVGTATLSLAPQVAHTRPEIIRFNINPFRGTVSGLQAGVSVERADPVSHVVVLTYSSSDAQVAADVPNVLAATFLSEKSQGLRAESQSTVRFLREQVASYEEQLKSAEDRLRSFRESQQVVSLTDEASEQVRRLAADQAEHDRLRSEREALAALLGEVTRASAGATQTSPYRRLASFPVFLSNRAVQDMLQTLTQLENRRADLLVQRTDANVDVQSITERVTEVERQLLSIARSYLTSLDSQIASKQTSLNRFGGELARIPAREVGFARLSREQNLLAEIYNLLQTRLKEAEIQEAAEPNDVRVIDSALVPLAPVSPRPVRTLGIGAVLGLALGIALAFLRQAVDTKVRSREDVAAATSGAPVLGMIPRMKMSEFDASASGTAAKATRAGRRGVTDLQPLGPITQLNPRSTISESYRALRTNITFAGTERSPQVIVVTSAFAGDGKSTTASNLAITLAQQGTRTLLVDADLRRGVLYTVFGIAAEPGLTHVLLGKVPLEQCISQVTAGEGDVALDVLPTGVLPPNPAELLGSQRARELIAVLRDRYEVVVFDAPPLNLVTDGAVLGTLADATVLVARNGVTDRRALEHAAQQLRQVGAPLSGVILNDIKSDAASYYQSYGYGYGYASANGNGNGRQS